MKSNRTVTITAIAVFSALPVSGQTGLYTLNGGTATQAGQSYAATVADQSAIYVLNSGKLTLSNPVITKTGDASSVSNSSQYGINAGVLAASAGTVTMSGGTVATNSAGSNGLFATGSGSSISYSNGSIVATGSASHGVDVTYGGSITLNNVNVTTSQGMASAALSTDFGGGTVTVTGGTIKTAGSGAPGIYSTGVITVTSANISATGEGGGVIDGANTISLTDTSLTGVGYGVKLHQTAPATGSAVVTVNGGSLNATSGDGFYLAPEQGTLHASLTVKGAAAVSSPSGNLVNATVASIVTLTLDGETLTGNLTTDSGSSIAATFQNHTTLSGAVNKAALTIDSTSAWNVTGNSVLTSLVDSSGVSGAMIVNITGNGYTVTYDATQSANSYLGGLTYTLVNGGILTPAGSTITATPSITPGGVVSAATFTAGVAPGAWVTIFGTNLADSTTTATSSNLAKGYLPTTLAGASVTIDGQPAYIDYASPTQLNVQAPADAGSGNVVVTVKTSAGTATSTAALQSVLPGLFSSSGYVLAVRVSDSVIINGTGAAYPGYQTAAAARPGDVLEIFATGLGATETAVAPGLVFSGAYSTSATPSVTIGSSTAAVSFSALVAAGLYQINLTVPQSLPAGSYPVILMQGGVSSPGTLKLNVETN